LYDWNFIQSLQYDDVYVISIGNITVGGTGKTPFVEYLVQTLSKKYRVAVLSRGYKRKTKGFRLVDSNTTVDEAGDESYQIKQKFPHIVVAVDVDRIRGIANIRKKYPDVQVILLDDAFQYRKINSNLSILLADYNRPLYCDSMLPGGRLREWSCFAQRADVMIVTKSPIDMSIGKQQEIEQSYARIFPRKIFFTSIKYGEPLPVFSNEKIIFSGDIKQYDVLLITGIANPKPFEDHVSQQAASVKTINYADHHAFTEKDINHIATVWNSILSSNKILLTTEKDAVRLLQMKVPEAIAKCSFYVPIEFFFVKGNSQFEIFDYLCRRVSPIRPAPIESSRIGR